MAELQKRFGRCLREARRSRGLTQAQLAEMVDRSLDMIGRLERGELAPSFETIERLCGALNVQAAELFAGQSALTMPQSKQLSEALALLEQMPSEKLKQALNVLRAL